MPTIDDLGRLFKQKHRGAYDDLPDAEVGNLVKKKWPGAYSDFEDASAPRPKAESTLSRLGTDVSLGFRSGVADLAHTAANIAEHVPGLSTVAPPIRAFEKKEAPTPQELAGREGITDIIAQGVGALPAGVVKYAPAMLSKRFAPIVAGVTDAAGAMDQGPAAALKAGARGAAGFYLQDKAATLESRLGRTVASSAAMALPTAIETGGDTTKTGAAFVLGGAMGALGPKPKAGTKSAMAAQTKAVESAIGDLRAFYAPGSRDAAGAKTARIARAHLANMAQRADRAEFALRKAREFFDDQKPTPGTPGGLSKSAFDFIDNIENGNLAGIPQEFRPHAQVIRDAFDTRLAELQKHGLLQTFVENYFPHLWKKPQQAAQAYQILSKRPFEGPKSFLRERKFASISEGLNFAQQNPGFGLELATSNPVDMALLKMREMDRLLTARDIMGEMKQNGLLQFVGGSNKPPAGYRKIDDKVSTVMFKSPKSGMWTIAGSYYAPDSAANVINNHLSPGLRSKEWFRAANLAGNSLNQFQLGWSAFHLGFTTFDAMMSNFSLGTEKIVEGISSGKGKYVAQGLADYAKAPLVALEPLAAPFIGKNRSFTNQIWEEWMTPGKFPQVAPIVEYMKQAGARVQQDPFYHTNIWRNMRRAFKQGDPVMAALKLPGALTEQAMKPIMEHIVPRQKIGAFARLAEFEVSRLPANYTQDQLRASMQKAWDSVDNRMGQLVYDNLFWNKTAKDLAMASVRSVGWNLGTFREIGGGLKDFATIHSRMAAGDKAVTHRMAYVATLPVVVGMIGGITHYLNTGKHPQGIDYWFPQTGKQDEYGRPERISFPTYMKDIYHYAHDFPSGAVKTLKGKIHPMFGVIGDMLQNQDWQGEKIRNEDDPLVQQAVQLAEYAGKQFEPFAARYLIRDIANKQKGLPPQYSAGERIGSFFGITPAPADIKKSDAEQYLDKHAAESYPAGGRTKGAAARFDAIRDIERAKRLKIDSSKIEQDAIQQGVITDKDVETAGDRATTSPVVRKLNRSRFDVALHAYELALEDLDRISVEEVTQIRDIVQRKVDDNIDAIYALPAGDKGRMRKIEQIRKLGLKLPGDTNVATAPPPGKQ